MNKSYILKFLFFLLKHLPTALPFATQTNTLMAGRSNTTLPYPELPYRMYDQNTTTKYTCTTTNEVK